LVKVMLIDEVALEYVIAWSIGVCVVFGSPRVEKEWSEVCKLENIYLLPFPLPDVEPISPFDIVLVRPPI